VFITTMGTATGTGPGSVRFNVLSNGGAERTGSVQVAGRTLTITQGGLPAQTCAFTVSPTDSTIEAAGGDVTGHSDGGQWVELSVDGNQQCTFHHCEVRQFWHRQWHGRAHTRK
jgi:hypothetical protein